MQNTNPTARVCERIALSLKRNGVTEIFGQSNPPSVTLACTKLGIRQVGYRQENAGSHMAQGFAMTAGKVGVVTAQNGPAATLIVAGLAECYKAGHPIVAIVQEIDRRNSDKNAFQELDHHALFSGVAKWVKTIPCQERVEDYVDAAFVAATSGRPGPAVLLCPIDLTNDPNSYPYDPNRPSYTGCYPLDRPIADPVSIEEAARLLANAENPLIYAGGGVIASGAQEEVRKLQEECGLPVATTTMGKGTVDELHPLSLGVIGYFMGRKSSTKFLKPMVQRSDVILLAGNRTNQNGTDGWSLLPKDARYIQIDMEPMEIGRNYKALRLFGDAKVTLAALSDALKKQDLSKRAAQRQAIEAEIAAARVSHAEEVKSSVESNAVPMRVERLLAEVDKRMDSDHIVVADASFSSPWLANYIKATGTRKFVFPRGLAGLGTGLPLAIGAAVAQPNRKVFCLAGDGGFGHSWSELETCKREGANVVVAVINNEILGYQKIAETCNYGVSTNACDLTAVNHAAVAEACGVMGIRVETPDQIVPAIEKAFAHNGPVVIDFVADPYCIPGVEFMMKMDQI